MSFPSPSSMICGSLHHHRDLVRTLGSKESYGMASVPRFYDSTAGSRCEWIGLSLFLGFLWHTIPSHGLTTSLLFRVRIARLVHPGNDLYAIFTNLSLIELIPIPSLVPHAHRSSLH